MFAFEQCLLCVGHHPDIWYEAAQFLDQSSKLLVEKGVSIKGFFLMYLLVSYLFNNNILIVTLAVQIYLFYFY